MSLALFLGFVGQYAAVELPRKQIAQLSLAEVNYCELASCPAIQGLVLTKPENVIENLEEVSFGTSVSMDFVNGLQLEGKRDLWLKLVSAEGELIEMASTEIVLDLKTRTTASFMLTSTKGEILAGTLMLGY
jgi:hypothetical protein